MYGELAQFLRHLRCVIVVFKSHRDKGTNGESLDTAAHSSSHERQFRGTVLGMACVVLDMRSEDANDWPSKDRGFPPDWLFS